jgi:hypothetical protein
MVCEYVHHKFFLKTTVGQSPPAMNILIKREKQRLTKSLKTAEKEEEGA